MDCSSLTQILLQERDRSSKRQILLQDTKVQDFIQKFPHFQSLLSNLSLEELSSIYSMLALGQGKAFFQGMETLSHPFPILRQTAEKLQQVDRFYESIGGLIGYHAAILDLLKQGGNSPFSSDSIHVDLPPLEDLSSPSFNLQEKALQGLSYLPEIAFIYPLGGAGDRLNLLDEKTGDPLPVAQLCFRGKTLFELLIEDLQGLEYLYFREFHRKITIPIAIMTSEEKRNHEKILDICEKNHWFKRPKESFRIFQQISVPVVTQSGRWIFQEPLIPLMKPGGHGALWKTMEDQGIWDWLLAQGRKRAFIRQVNNPSAGSDQGMMAMAALGIEKKKAVVFASCPRKVGVAEGINVLREIQSPKGFSYALSNIEYTELREWEKTYGESKNFDHYPTNTNLLFIDLEKVRQAALRHPLPGIMLNMKQRFSFLNSHGQKEEDLAGRLELMLQNITDNLSDHFPYRLPKEKHTHLQTMVTFNQRTKTISPIKKAFVAGQSFEETPESCLYDQLANFHELLQKDCSMAIPPLGPIEAFLTHGPSFLCFFHPTLGPFYSEIARKIQGGKLHKGSELYLNIAEIILREVDLQGSLLIHSEALQNNDPSASRCLLHKVHVINQGINRSANNIYWKGQIERKESLQIVLKGHSEFIAQNLTIEGNRFIEVPDGYRKTALMKNNQLTFTLEKLL